ncbi:exonuclease [Candidatus Photodesmus katoptron Akat1]|uniref:DNA polymerase I n=1 Tax=Candidatus Photodesmus katoptron Akat1 TaxID=1236703 RepID=S3E1G4_9GAMM|nr:exonuclease [Candidatus Photodesmus katoptron Akat1]
MKKTNLSLPSHLETINKDDKYKIILAEQELIQWIEKLKAKKIFSIYTKTNHSNYMLANLIGISFAIEEKIAMYIPFAHDYQDAPKQLNYKWVLSKLKPLLEDPTRSKVGYNLKYDLHILARYGIQLRGIQHDIMIASHILNSTSRKNDIVSLAVDFLEHQCQCISLEKIARKGKQQFKFNQITLEETLPYSAKYADIILQLHNKIFKKIEHDSELKLIYKNIEIPLIFILFKMERTGVLIDDALLNLHSYKISNRLQELEFKIYKITNNRFNINSTKQLQTILFESMNFPIIKKTPSGKPSTSEEVLQELALYYPLPKLILEYRNLTKLKSNYIEKLPKMINMNTGRIHTSYHQVMTTTGRLSSSDPNLQNIPIRNKLGRRIRKAFIAKDNYKILSVDYSQIELRIMAHLSGDKNLLNAFQQGKDIHIATAAEILSVNAKKISNEQRYRAKAINFGLIYGISAFGLAKQLNISQYEAQQYINRYFKRYSGIFLYMENLRKIAYKQGFVETLFKRRIYLPEIKSKNKIRQKAAERSAINAPIQGTAADIIKKAMLLVSEWIEFKANDNVELLMQVHDELVFEVHKSILETAKNKIQKLMESAAKLNIPLLTKAKYGDDWDQAH